MSKVTKKYLLISIEDAQNQRGLTKKIRRYLNANKLSYILSAEPEEIKSYVDKVCSKNANFEKIAKEQLANYECSLVGAPSNQEILERWAQSGHHDISTPLNLLFGAQVETGDEIILMEEDNESNGGSSPRDAECAADKGDDIERETADNKGVDDTVNDQTIFYVDTTDSAPAHNDLLDGKKDEEDVLQLCLLCKVPIDVGKNRNTKIRRQAQHILDFHPKNIFNGLDVSKRYQCLRCYKVISVHKSPCEHIGDHHSSEEAETEFTDLWNKEQLSEFNTVLGLCFDRQLPVPRSRRDRHGLTFPVPSKASYRIKQGDDVVQVDTIAEKEKEKKQRPPVIEVVIDDDDEFYDDYCKTPTQTFTGDGVQNNKYIKNQSDDEI